MRGAVAGAVLALAIGIGARPTYPAEICQQDTIVAVATAGAAMEMRSGQTVRVDDFDRRLAASWPPSSDVLVCRRPAEEDPALPPIRIVNRDADGSVYGWFVAR